MFDQELFGAVTWQQCQDRHRGLQNATRTGRPVRQRRDGRLGCGEPLGGRLGDLLIAAGVKLGGRVRAAGANSTIPVYRWETSRPGAR